MNGAIVNFTNGLDLNIITIDLPTIVNKFTPKSES